MSIDKYKIFELFILVLRKEVSVMYNKHKNNVLFDWRLGMATIGDRIKTIRKAHKLTQTDFGDIFGIAKTTVSSYENGRSVPDDSIKIAICKHFNVTTDYLLGIIDSTLTQSIRFSGFLFSFENSNELETFAKNIQNKGIQKVSEITNISIERLEKLIQGAIKPEMTEISSIAAACDCSLEELLGIKEKTAPNGLPLSSEQEALLESCAELPTEDIKKVLEYVELLKLKHNS